MLHAFCRVRVCLVVLLLGGAVSARAQDPAAHAWAAGDHAAAARLYAARVAADPDDAVALHRLALLTAWSERFAESLDLFARLRRLAPEDPEVRIDHARVLGWSGSLAEAVDTLDAVLQTHPANLTALRLHAQLAGWAGETDVALATYDQLANLDPADREIGRNRARVLTMASRYDEAVRVYDSLLATDPDDLDALAGLARLHSWAGRLDTARAMYEHLLAEKPSHLEARQGLARIITWQGALIRGEARWRETLALDPDNVETLVGLGQTLRWQGRHAAAHAVLERALRLSPNDRDVLTQVRWAQTALEPRASVNATFESDSDRNRVLSMVTRGAWRPAPYVEIRAEAYRREAGFGGPLPQAHSTAVRIRGWRQFEPGWSVSLGVGGVTAGTGTDALWDATVSSPARDRVSWSLAVARSAFDHSSALINRQVLQDRWTWSARARFSPRLTVEGELQFGWMRGSRINRRWGVIAAATHRPDGPWALGGRARLFGYAVNVTDPYFDPGYYGLWEGIVRWSRAPGPWTLTVDLAPGLQQVRTASVSPAVRVAAAGVYRLAPGRELSLRAVYSSAGVQDFTTDASDYRYTALSFAASWLF